MLFVVEKTKLLPGDEAVYNRLIGKGYTVTTVEDKNTSSSDADGKDLVLISGSCKESNIGTEFRDVSVPVITWCYKLYPYMEMTGSSNSDYGAEDNQDEIVIINESHYLSAGLISTTTVLSSDDSIVWGNPASGAQNIAAIAGENGEIVIFAYEKNSNMDGIFTAPERRVGFFPNKNTPQYFNDVAWMLFDAAVEWSTGSSDFKPHISIVASTPTVPEAGPGSGVFTVSRDTDVGDITVYYSVSGTAENGTDYAAITGTATIYNTQISTVIPVVPIYDTYLEGDETVIVEILDNSAEYYVIASSRQATVSIIDERIISVSINSGEYDFGVFASAGIEVLSLSSVTVVNNGNVDLDYSLMITTASSWGLDINNPGDDIFSFQCQFNSIQPSTGSFSASLHGLTTFFQQCGTSSGKFAGDETGYNVPPSSERHLWEFIKLPLATSTTSQQVMILYIEAQEN
jgi:hypothetical protein